ncbi:hypothetical protein Slala01_55300 [Streptomyces lavendulae subsp. lavendulae]|nr:hypothetical protein Slala01_55300 [Streptomyces lavendulae subsp. lavendulae]
MPESACAALNLLSETLPIFGEGLKEAHAGVQRFGLSTFHYREGRHPRRPRRGAAARPAKGAPRGPPEASRGPVRGPRPAPARPSHRTSPLAGTRTVAEPARGPEPAQP